ncbi:MAG: ATP-binding protein [Nitrospirota bacterium]
MKKDLLKGIIRDFHVAPLAEFIDRDIEVPLSSGKIISLIGARRSGKTSLLLNSIRKLKKEGLDTRNVLYLNFEDERLDLKTGELDLILQAYRELYPDLNLKECYLIFDEIQNVQNWEKFIRRVYDSITRNIFITGSNSRFLSVDIATSLRGRTLSYEVFPLSFREYLRFNEVGIDLHSSGSLAKINNSLHNYLDNGGFPEVVRYDDKLREKVLQEYFNVMIYRDLVERYEIKNAAVLKFFIKRVLASSTKQLSVNTIYNELKSSGFKIGKNQLYEYLDACQSIYLAFVLRKYARKFVSRELGERKVYCIDNGLLNAVNFRFSDDRGKAIEQAVFLELRRRGEDIYFFRGRYECDFVVKEGNNVSEVIQVSQTLADEKTKKREMRGIVDACKEFRLKRGIIITNDTSQDFEVEKINIRAVPLYYWLLTDKE